MAETYNVYNGTTKVASELTEKTFKAQGLGPKTKYTFSVTSVTDGVESDKASVTFTTEAQLVTSIMASQQTMAIKVGDADREVSFTVVPANASNKELTITSSNTAVATYVNGKVHPVAEGTANIVATAKDGSGKTAKIAVTVSAAATE